MLSHVFLLKVFMSSKRYVLLFFYYTDSEEVYMVNTHLLFTTKLVTAGLSYKPFRMLEPSGCRWGKYKCLVFEWHACKHMTASESRDASPILQTMSSHSLMLLARSTTQQKPVDWGVSGESLWTQPIMCLDDMGAQPMTRLVYCIMTSCRRRSVI